MRSEAAVSPVTKPQQLACRSKIWALSARSPSAPWRRAAGRCSRRKGAGDDEVDLARRDAGPVHRPKRRFRRVVGRRVVRRRDRAPLDAGLLEDPCRRHGQGPAERLVVLEGGGQVMPDPGDGDARSRRSCRGAFAARLRQAEEGAQRTVVLADAVEGRGVAVARIDDGRAGKAIPEARGCWRAASPGSRPEAWRARRPGCRSYRR